MQRRRADADSRDWPSMWRFLAPVSTEFLAGLVGVASRPQRDWHCHKAQLTIKNGGVSRRGKVSTPHRCYLIPSQPPWIVQIAYALLVGLTHKLAPDRRHQAADSLRGRTPQSVNPTPSWVYETRSNRLFWNAIALSPPRALHRGAANHDLQDFMIFPNRVVGLPSSVYIWPYRLLSISKYRSVWARSQMMNFLASPLTVSIII